MDVWLYYDVLHRRHRYLNPVSHETLLELGEVLGLGPGRRVLDIASGVGEVLVGFAERHGSSGVGVDASPHFHRRAEERRQARVPDADLVFLQGRGEDYRLPDEGPFDVAMCLGASWIWGGFGGTLRALAGFVRPGGLIAVMEPWWMSDPPDAYLEAEDLTRDQFHDLAGCRDVALEQGLAVVWMRRASAGDWDRYEMLQSASLDEFAAQEPGHPDLPEIRRRRLVSEEAYLRWGKDCLGDALWVFRAPGKGAPVSRYCEAAS